MSNPGWARAAGDPMLTEIHTTMATIGTKLDLLIRRVDPLLRDHEARLRKLEQKVWLASGVALTGGGVVGTLLSHFTGA